ncbi:MULTISPECIES: ABC transporter ATP-binding protein [Bacillus]|jgi:peptide/nickel transport system ATP-binding protein|uniref:Dipeptide ABC transporter ATP-binding protein n=2 Tax=Bacillus amyloliquefaciens group TaxID=1938374 RepID=A0ABC8D3D4_BACVE|nr:MULTISPECIES: dipeptide ABC transporter ATP-binding protein [Bacillus]AIW36974.1 peptide ABC transporter ATPase [Bacillus subtilis]ARM27335.1 dipeptide/oligopeptide/nickel ABC transporter ATP-binding protein [Bacillus vallismortis]MBZ6417066.1 dipeptide ABC transporter ATP-binding protein [Methylobacterium sp.]SLC02750.1 oligopeptide/dipeptide ABC transporter ATPase [Mycobacteroides abscessus subsp. massiliense]AHZ15110.1 AppF [Bacillus velezensis SQR9]
MTAAGQETILELKDVKKYFPIRSGFFQRKVGDIKAVDGVSFSLKRGETLGIVGESGCGKSTAGRTMIRLYKPTDGRILFKGQDISGLSEEKLRKSVRKNIQMVFQDPFASLNPRKTLRSIIKEPFQTHHMYSMSERNERVEELLAKVGLHPSFANRYPHEFSGGQRQRIGIARALTLNPELIIADEPVSALDVSIQAQVINLMEELQEEFNLTYLFISHDLSVVRHISDRVGVMYLGKMMELTDKHELYGNPLHPYTQALLSSVPVTRKKDAVKRERIILKGELPSPANPPKGCVFHTRCPMAKPICKEQIPAFEEAAPGHYVACHLYA